MFEREQSLSLGAQVVILSLLTFSSLSVSLLYIYFSGGITLRVLDTSTLVYSPVHPGMDASLVYLITKIIQTMIQYYSSLNQVVQPIGLLGLIVPRI